MAADPALAGRRRFGGLWRDADFLKLWAALSVSLMGTQVTALALPLIAALTLDASPLQMGVLAAAGQVPFVLVSLPAGVWVDRVRRRPLLIATDVGSGLLLLSVPATAAIGEVRFAQLCLVAFGVGALAVVGEVAHYAYTPSVLGRADLVEGNSKFQVSHSAAAAAGPGLGGLLIQLLSAPVAVLLDAASFLASALLVRAIDRPEPASARATADGSPARLVAAGMRFLLGHPLLRPIILAGSVANGFLSASIALYLLYATRELGLDPATIGVVFAVGGVFAVPGALLAPWAGRVLGVGPAIIGGWVLSALAAFFVPLASGPTGAVVAVLAAARALDGVTETVANIHQWTLRQTVTPDDLQGRVTASHRFVVYGAGAFGALAGGTLGSVLGLRAALVVCAAGALLAFASLLFSPLRHLREQPADADDDTGVTGTPTIDSA
ncbi:MAG: MFS transporter [Chloroflexota bacterium]|nr:MFS transporter [Chloroflexota bacterium]